MPVAGQRTQGTTFRELEVTSQVATPGAESAVCHCLVVDCCRCLQFQFAYKRKNVNESAALSVAVRKFYYLLLLGRIACTRACDAAHCYRCSVVCVSVGVSVEHNDESYKNG